MIAKTSIVMALIVGYAYIVEYSSRGTEVTE